MATETYPHKGSTLRTDFSVANVILVLVGIPNGSADENALIVVCSNSFIRR